MKELSLNILDVATNSITAGATTIRLTIAYLLLQNRLAISIEDDGCGMSQEILQKVCDPFTTSRTTRKVGLGLPLFKQSAESTGGSFEITSTLSVGTKVSAVFCIDNIDCMPMGDLTGTLITLLQYAPKIRWIVSYIVDDNKFDFDTNEVKAILGEVDLDSPEVLSFLTDYIKQNINTINGGEEIL